LPESLQVGGRAAFMGRLVLAATLAGNYGIYGPPFELGWSGPREPGSEEYLNSEKYEVHQHDIHRPDSLRDFIARVNGVRRTSVALAHGGELNFHTTDNDQILCYSRISADGSEVMLMVVSVDYRFRQSAWIELPADMMGLVEGRPYQMHDLLTDARYLWHGNRNYVELDPANCPAHIFRLRRRSRSERDFEYFF
jgi:starch synthase (maltosyl-transferring)